MKDLLQTLWTNGFLKRWMLILLWISEKKGNTMFKILYSWTWHFFHPTTQIRRNNIAMLLSRIFKWPKGSRSGKLVNLLYTEGFVWYNFLLHIAVLIIRVIFTKAGKKLTHYLNVYWQMRKNNYHVKLNYGWRK